MIDEATHFNAAQFVEPLTTESVWDKILTLLATVQTVLPNMVVFDDDSQLRETFVEIYKTHNVEWQRYRAQQHSALGIGEKYQ